MINFNFIYSSSATNKKNAYTHAVIEQQIPKIICEILSKVNL